MRSKTSFSRSPLCSRLSQASDSGLLRHWRQAPKFIGPVWTEVPNK